MDIRDLLSKAQLEIKHNRGMAIAALSITALIAVELAIYLPIKSSLKASAAHLILKTLEIETARATGLTQISPEELNKLQQRTRVLNEGFVDLAEISTVLDRISDHAEKNNIRVVNINSDEPVLMKTDETETGQKFTRLPIRIKLEGRYQSIAEFVQSLAETSRQIFVVETYKISKPNKGGGLDCEMVLSFFFNQ